MYAFVTSHLDNGNALLNGITEQQLKKLQLVQNSTARVLTKTQKFDHITLVTPYTPMHSLRSSDKAYL